MDACTNHEPVWDFTLHFLLPPGCGDGEAWLDALYEAGCDDAGVGFGRPGVMALDFSRAAPTAAQALQSACADVLRAIPGADLIEVSPDLVNLSDLADLVGCSRQNIRKYAVGAGAADRPRFPEPIVTANPSLWRLAEALVWLREHTSLGVPLPLIDLAKATAELGLALQQQRWQAVGAGSQPETGDAVPCRAERADPQTFLKESRQ